MAKPIIVWLTPMGPNPWKVVIILEELQVPYEIKSITFPEVKQKPYLNINPNGRVPTIQDPNTNLTLWETGAIIEYLIEQYDPHKTLSYGNMAEDNLLRQWLMFQVSTQGPYYGQSSCFNNLHPEKIQSAIDRYGGELRRILSVLENHLSGAAPGNGEGAPTHTPRSWLVGNKMTYADLSFVPWNAIAPITLPTGPSVDPLEDFPHVLAWHKRMTARPAFRRSWELRDKGIKEQNLTAGGLQEGQTYQSVMDEVEKAKRET